MKILITGASGMLGNAVINLLKRDGTRLFGEDVSLRLIDRNPVAPGILALDICDRPSLAREIHDYRPDFIFHLAAETDVDLCESQPEYCYSVNSAATRSIAEIAGEEQARIIYISSAAVFPGTSETPYSEEDDPGPVNIYGNSKLRGEEAVRQCLEQYYIVRAGWLFGGGLIDKKFVQKIYQQILAGSDTILSVNDKFGSPTYTYDFAGNLLALVKSGRFGTYHIVNHGIATRYDIANEMVGYLNQADRIKVVPVGSDRFPTLAPRGKYETLKNHRLSELGINKMPEWIDSLHIYLDSLKSES
jgi:dTDP-4-dehydrorhamnose reductase